MKFKFLPIVILFLVFASSTTNAQLPNGSIAPDFTAMDIDGVEHNLYDILAEGKSVVLDFITTWCYPCWEYHESNQLHDYLNLYGPNGTDESIVLYIECDEDTTMDDLLGLTSSSQGNWVTGNNAPIIDESYIKSLFKIAAYPSRMIVCPDRSVQFIELTFNPNFHDIYALSQNCASIDVLPEVEFRADAYHGCNSLEVQFIESSWPRADNFLWNFGDGTTSTEESPTHTYTAAGSYDVSLTASNAYGEQIKTKENFILLGEGLPLSDIQSVGPEDNTIGTGKYFQSGSFGLVFNAHQDIILASVKVFSEIEAERTFVVHDENGNLIHLKKIMVPEGEQVVELDIFIPEGTDYSLQLQSNAFFYRNNSGANYPYSIANLIDITKNTLTSSPFTNYYYFYDWQVKEAGCDGNIVSIENENITKELTKIYPLPAESYLIIESIHKDFPKVYNVNGQLQIVPIFRKEKGWEMDIKSLNAGMYFIKTNNEINKIIKI